MTVRQTTDRGYIVLGNVADQADGGALYFPGNMPGPIYLAKLGPDNGAGIDPDQDIPLWYAPSLVVLIVFGILGCRKKI